MTANGADVNTSVVFTKVETTGTLTVMLDTQGYILTSFRLILTKDGVQNRLPYDGNYNDGSSIIISDLDVGTYRISVTSIAGYQPPWEQSYSLKGNISPSSIQISVNTNSSVVLSVSSK